MKNERLKTRLGMLMLATGATFFAACAVDADGGKEAESELAAGEQAAHVEPINHFATAAEASLITGEATPKVACRRVTAGGGIPAFTHPTGGSVSCRFFHNDLFSHFGQIVSSNRYITWCPRGVPPSQGTTAYAQGAGTIDGGCGS